MQDSDPNATTIQTPEQRTGGSGMRLLVLGTDGAKPVPLEPGATLTFGRGTQANVQVDDANMSRVHFQIEIAEEVLISDLGSSNGTHVAGVRLGDSAQVLACGEIVSAGATVFMLEGPASTQPGAPQTLQNVTVAAERQRVIEALRECAGNQTKAAKMLGISRRTLVSRLDAFGLPRPRKNK